MNQQYKKGRKTLAILFSYVVILPCTDPVMITEYQSNCASDPVAWFGSFLYTLQELEQQILR